MWGSVCARVCVGVCVCVHDESENAALDIKGFTLPRDCLFKNWVSCFCILA